MNLLLALLFGKSSISKSIIACSLCSKFFRRHNYRVKDTRNPQSHTRRALSSKPARHLFRRRFTHVFVVVVDRSSDIVRGVRR